jgi:TPR repeat protein
LYLTYLSYLPKGKREFDPEVIDYYTFLANEGDVNAAITLGNLHLQGTRYIDQDLPKAAQYFRIASDSGNAIAAGTLGYLVAQNHPSDLGQGMNVSSIRALLQYASNRGDPSGIVGLGYLYYRGIAT